MKSRLRHQRTSNELIYFLRECQKSTGYYSKLNELKQGSMSTRTGGGASSSFDSSSLESTSFYNAKSATSRAARRPLTGAVSNKFRSTSYLNNSSSFTAADAIATSRCGDLQLEGARVNSGGKKLTPASIIKITAPPSLFIDTSSIGNGAARDPITSNNNSNNNSTNNPTPKTSTSRSSNSSSVFSSNSSESLVAESTSTTGETGSSNSNTRSIKIQLRPTIIRPQTAQLAASNRLFTKVSTPKILKNKNHK